jgi:predicted HicB family RNase H-like nuclease
MAKQTKPKIGRPKLPKGEAKGRIVPIRFNPSDLKRIELVAKASQKTVSEWIRSAITMAMEAQ